MSIQTEIMLAETNRGLQILEINEKQTLLPKNHIAQIHAEKIRQAILSQDSYLMGEVVVELIAIANQLGFGNMPGGYLLKHNGFMVGRGLLTKNGIRSDLTITVRTPTSLT